MFVCSLLIARCRRIMLAIAIAMGVVSCATYNEELGRNQILLGDPQAFARSANAAWTQIKQKERISTKPRYTSRLNRVAPRLLSAIGENPANWEYLVFDSEDLNAFALPGNKIG
ncbi:MAG: M48 family peptidase, partial [Pseudomonadota bacterium]